MSKKVSDRNSIFYLYLNKHITSFSNVCGVRTGIAKQNMRVATGLVSPYLSVNAVSRRTWLNAATKDCEFPTEL